MKEARYCELSRNERQFAFCIEDPIDIGYNPGYSVLGNSREYEKIIYEFQRAYVLITSKEIEYLLNPRNQ